MKWKVDPGIGLKASHALTGGPSTSNLLRWIGRSKGGQRVHQVSGVRHSQIGSRVSGLHSYSAEQHCAVCSRIGKEPDFVSQAQQRSFIVVIDDERGDQKKGKMEPLYRPMGIMKLVRTETEKGCTGQPSLSIKVYQRQAVVAEDVNESKWPEILGHCCSEVALRIISTHQWREGSRSRRGT